MRLVLHRHARLISPAAAAVLALAACSAGQTDVTGAQVENGKRLYQEYCQTCHGGPKGGKLRDIPPPHNRNGHTWEHPDRQLKDIILNSAPAVPGQVQMPAFKGALDDAQIQAILAYVKTMWTEEQRAHQATVTAQTAQ